MSLLVSGTFFVPTKETSILKFNFFAGLIQSLGPLIKKDQNYFFDVKPRRATIFPFFLFGARKDQLKLKQAMITLRGMAEHSMVYHVNNRRK